MLQATTNEEFTAYRCVFTSMSNRSTKNKFNCIYFIERVEQGYETVKGERVWGRWSMCYLDAHRLVLCVNTYTG